MRDVEIRTNRFPTSESVSKSGVQKLVSMSSLWILETDSASRMIYDDILGSSYRLEYYSQIKQFKMRLKQNRFFPDLVIADLQLQDLGFLDFLRQEQNSSEEIDFPFIIASHQGDYSAVKTAFENGALDYLTKPLGAGEFRFKVERALKKTQKAQPYTAPRSGDGFELDMTSMSVRSTSEKKEAQLTAKEFQILSVLRSQWGRKVERQTLEDQVWGNVAVGNKTLCVHMHNLRKKIASVGLEVVFLPPSYYCLRKRVPGAPEAPQTFH